MPTENDNLQPIVRDVATLLSLSTYQGMSDEEIDSLIEYHVNFALQSDEQQASISSIEAVSQAQAAAYRAMAEDSHNVLQSVLSRQIPWATVSEDGTVIQNV